MEALLLEFILTLSWASLEDDDQGGKTLQVNLLSFNILCERF